ncbi:MAG: prepilin peptidase [Alphaproteobacteria bacterium]|nr:MAG: prepilin peptidase [Alphaproteobacteria bacterium]
MKHPAEEQGLKAELRPIAAAVGAPLTLVLTGLAAIWAGYHTGQNPPLVFGLTLFAYLLALLAVIDSRHGILPHLLTGTLGVLGILLAPTFGHTHLNALNGGLLAFTGIGFCAFVTERLTGKQAVGGGDLWLVAALGTWLGAGGMPMLLVATAVTGVVSVLIRRWLTQNMLTYAHVPANSFPFGPALCAAGWLAMLYAPAYWQGIDMLVGTAS